MNVFWLAVLAGASFAVATPRAHKAMQYSSAVEGHVGQKRSANPLTSVVATSDTVRMEERTIGSNKHNSIGHGMFTSLTISSGGDVGTDEVISGIVVIVVEFEVDPVTGVID
ncbi:hypothetical protein HIM_08523 [Hirsutella minnesotensis 3608]|uniref:Uncharacterized protein n=1 Tax=Hirsutella minnesotensis 3608 TaxID=1043627 RepID=A0A0F7ZSW4_9HYPO|nr:hypothetical protein HIM_08523 [Hirsutella minnesotensis 3608]